MPNSDLLAAELAGTVRDAMVNQVVAVLPRTSVVEVAERLTSQNIRQAIVTDRERHVLGVVSQRDLLRHFTHGPDQPVDGNGSEEELAPWEIGSLIRRKPVTIVPDIPLAKAAVVLASAEICCLPVVNADGSLLGSLSINEVLRHMCGNFGPRLESTFQVFKPVRETRPKLPAYFRRSSGALVLPLSCLEEDSNSADFAVLGYDRPSGRILVKLVGDSEEGSRRVMRDKENLVIPAADFVAHFDIKFHGSAFDVTTHANNSCLILSPKQAQTASCEALAARAAAVSPK